MADEQPRRQHEKALNDKGFFILLTNSNRGLRLMDDMTRDILPGSHAAIRWLAENVSE